MKKTLRDKLLQDVYFYFKEQPYVTNADHNKTHLKDLVEGAIYQIEETVFSDYEHSLDALISVVDSEEETTANNLLYESRPPEAKEIMERYADHFQLSNPEMLRTRLMMTYSSLHRLQRTYKVASIDQRLLNDLGIFIDIVQRSRQKT